MTPEVAACFADAIEDVRRGGVKLRHTYMGVKSYDRWDSQREDSRYGYGPRHGHIWFRIELVGARRRDAEPLSSDERVACVRYLRAVQSDPAMLLGQGGV